MKSEICFACLLVVFVLSVPCLAAPGDRFVPNDGGLELAMDRYGPRPPTWQQQYIALWGGMEQR